MNTTIKKFEFKRSRGIVWVCDLAKSSQFLNDDSSAGALEEFLPRLYWTSLLAVEAAGGIFVKWTGDGFLAWFETPLHREISQKVSQVFHAAFTLTTLVNITKLLVKSQQKFHIRHGVCFEHDALVIRISHSSYKSIDLIGRAVVLAFRMSELPAGFPRIVTQKDLVFASPPPKGFTWKRKKLSEEDRLKYFKGEKWGANSIYVSADKNKRPNSLKSTTRLIKKTLSDIDKPETTAEDTFGAKFVPRMLSGPEWSQEAIKEYADHWLYIYNLVRKSLKIIEGGNGTDLQRI